MMPTGVTNFPEKPPGGGDGGDYGERLARLDERMATLATREFVTAAIGSLKAELRAQHSGLKAVMGDIKTAVNVSKWLLGALVTGAIGAGAKLLFELF